MGNFKRDNKFGGRGGNRKFNDRNSRKPEMHRAICSECGKNCEVPFKPTGDKPVLCSDCFRNSGGSEPRRSGGRDSRSGGRDSRRFNSGDKRMHEAICDKCGNKCEIPFKPTSGKPVFCSQCFDKRDKTGGSDQDSKQFEIINDKLDKILKALSPTVLAEVDEKKKSVKKMKVVKPKKESKSKVKKVASPKKAKAKKKK